MSTRFLAYSAFTVLALLAGCEIPSGDRNVQLPVVRDSAGIRIIENAEPSVGDPGRWASVDPEPAVRIGEMDGAEPYLFTWVIQAFEAADGSIVVADLDTRQLRVFDRAGSHVRTFGRSGDGPGEFRAQPRIRLIAPDTVVAWDAGARRLTWFTLDGTITREESIVELPLPLTLSPPPWIVLGDGSLLHMDPVPFVPPEDRRGMVERHRNLLVRPGGSSELTTIRDLPGGTALYGASGASFGNPDIAADAGGSWAVRTDPLSVVIADDPMGRWALSVYDFSGTRTESIRIGLPRAAFTADLADRERSRLLERLEREPALSPREAADLRSAVRGLSFPDSARAIEGVIADSSDQLWVRRWRGAWNEEGVDTYDVISPDGAWLGCVEIPGDLGRVLSIGEDHVLSLRTDPLGVPRINRHGLARVP